MERKKILKRLEELDKIYDPIKEKLNDSIMKGDMLSKVALENELAPYFDEISKIDPKIVGAANHYMKPNKVVDKVGKLTKAGLKGLGKLLGPVTGLAAAAYSGDLNAAVPMGMEVESLGPKKDSLDYNIENPESKLNQLLMKNDENDKEGLENLKKLLIESMRK